MVSRLALTLVLLGCASCELDPGVIYRCNPDLSCSRPDYVCDGEFCVPSSSILDGGLGDGGGVDAGSVDAGAIDAGGTDAGAVDAGVEDAGPSLDAGIPDAGETDAGVICPPCAVSCGFVDAGPGCANQFCGYCTGGLHCGEVTPNTCSTSRQCSGGWCWENLLPQGNTLRGVFVRSRRDVFIVGDAATVLHFDGERFALMPVPISNSIDLFAVDGNSTEIVVVGSGGTVLSWDGIIWRTQASSTTTTLRAVTVLPSTTPGAPAFAVGWNATAVRRLSGSWSPVSGGTGDLQAVASNSAGVVRVLGRTPGPVFRLELNPVALVQEDTLGFSGRGLSVAGDTWFAVGQRNSDAGTNESGVFKVLSFFDGGAPMAVIPIDATAVQGQGSGDIFVAGDLGELFHVSPNGGISANLSTTDNPHLAIASLARSHPLLVGTDGSLAVCQPPCDSAAQFSLLSLGTSRELFKACGTTEENLVVMADRSCSGNNCSLRALEYSPADLGSWSRVDFSGTPLADGPFTQCLEVTSNEVVAMTSTGRLFSRTGPRGTPFVDSGRLPLDAGVLSVFESWSGSTDYEQVWYVLTDANRVWSFPDGGMAGSEFVDLSGPRQNALWGTAWDLLTVGRSGAARYLDRSPLTSVQASSGSQDTQRDLHGVVFPDGGTLLVSAGERGSVWWRGSTGTFVATDAGLGNDVTSVWVSAGGVTALGTATGQLLVGDPRLTSWTLSPTLTNRPLDDVWGLNLADGGVRIWVMAAHGVLMSRSLP